MGADRVWNPDLPKTPVVFLVFNRPDLTARVFERIRAARPDRLLIVADGPRASRPGEATECEQTRQVVSVIDWPCAVETNFADSNMGCRDRVSSGIDWAFSLVDEAIILEDDCLPDLTFFRFCQELLHKYRDEPVVMHVSGANLHNNIVRDGHDYYFSRHAHIWGWATWRRAWALYDRNLRKWRTKRDLKRMLGKPINRALVRHFEARLDATAAGTLNTWDYQWMFTCWAENGICITPMGNLVANIGFDARATHTKRDSDEAHLAVYRSPFPLRHPPEKTRDVEADDTTERLRFHDSPIDFARETTARIVSLVNQRLHRFFSVR